MLECTTNFIFKFARTEYTILPFDFYLNFDVKMIKYASVGRNGMGIFDMFM